MRPVHTILFLTVFLSGTPGAFAQTDESELRIFGYFQNSFQHWTEQPAGDSDPGQPALNSFATQQLNLFLQKDLAKNWRAFINFEALNNFSTSRQWGSFNLEEAWVRYRYDERLNVKFGMQIPIFNHLNEIKNRTPLLPYVIRPLVYETSFSEFVSTEEFVPVRTFGQAYGFLSAGEVKLDYAAYIGNSPNISSQPDQGPAGLDTTDTFLFGGRVGIRYKDLKLGISATHDRTDILVGLDSTSVGGSPGRFKEMRRIRLGGDASYHKGRFSLEGEFIIVRYHDGVPILNFNKEFFYGNMGYRITEPWLAYAGYWLQKENGAVVDSPMFPANPVLHARSDSEVYTFGMAYNLNERITLKGQVGLIDTDEELPAIQLKTNSDFDHYSFAISVFF